VAKLGKPLHHVISTKVLFVVVSMLAFFTYIWSMVKSNQKTDCKKACKYSQTCFSDHLY